MIIAIDGPAGSGKSSTAKLVAQRLGILHLDTGAMYRAITLKCLRMGISHTDFARLAECVRNTELRFTGSLPNMKVWMDGEDVSDAIRGDAVTKNVSDYCAPALVREEMVRQQREMGKLVSAVCEGRDIGTVVFPKAELKFFMIASVNERALRRRKDFEKLGVHKSIEELVREIELRDKKDSTRKNSPLKQAPDAIVLDTTGMTLQQQVDFIVEKARTAGF